MLMEVSKDLVVGPDQEMTLSGFWALDETLQSSELLDIMVNYYASCPYLLKVDVALLVKVCCQLLFLNFYAYFT